MAFRDSETENSVNDEVAVETETVTDEHEGRGTWRHAAFHVATIIATPAAYAPLPFAVASLGWSLGSTSLVAGTLATWYSSLLIASLWRWDGKKHTTYRHLAKSIYDIHSLRWVNALCTLSTVGFAGTSIGVTVYNGKKADRESVSYSLQGSSSAKAFKAFNALGAIAFSFGDAMLPEIQSTVRKPAKGNMYKGVSAAYAIIVVTYWQLAFLGYWAFGSEVEPYIVASLTTPRWTIVMANLFAVIQISGCFQIYCRPTYAYFEGRTPNNSTLQAYIYRLFYTSIYISLITLVASAMPFFGDFVSICGAVGFTPLDFVFPVLAYMKAGKLPRHKKLRLAVMILNSAIAAWFSIVAVLGCIGALRTTAMRERELFMGTIAGALKWTKKNIFALKRLGRWYLFHTIYHLEGPNCQVLRA
ncbi:hypothetical protein DH2020_001421 [Rehmannia glutinosa]|uniref:Amino acid transporter transmembrane domain-containing protein n=1 Tax=Rehmannia glutinosa TaxID=99300 RepID=A0ABR0XZB0_REHGL